MENDYKEVYFGQYCPTCRHLLKDGDEPPCDECLDEPVNLNSHKPIKYESR